MTHFSPQHKSWGLSAEADLWFLVPWARFPDCAFLSDGPSTTVVSPTTFLL